MFQVSHFKVDEIELLGPIRTESIIFKTKAKTTLETNKKYFKFFVHTQFQIKSLYI